MNFSPPVTPNRVNYPSRPCLPEGSTKSDPKDLAGLIATRHGSAEILRFAQDDKREEMRAEVTRVTGEKSA
jgi:hypothetical protein